MFEEIFGLPAHPLIIHAAVVFLPLLVVGAIAYALLPGQRRRIGWLVIALAVAAPLAAVGAKLSGDAFRARLIREHRVSAQGLANINTHRSYANPLMWWAIALGVVTLLMVVNQIGQARAKARGIMTDARAEAGDTTGPDAATANAAAGVRAMSVALTAASVILALIVGYYVFRTGDTGARAVWGGV